MKDRTTILDEIREKLYQMQDIPYRDFQSRLIPTANPETIIGVRTPELRRLAKEFGRREDTGDFLDAIPHTYFEETQLHAFIVSAIKDFAECLALVDRFLPCIDNWATCDQMSPKVFKKHRQELSGSVRRWISGNETYTVRFGIKMLMDHYLEESFRPEYPEIVSAIRSDEYYIRMMQAWYFATALAKQYDAVLPCIEQRKLDSWTHNKSIQKAIESYRISPEQKEYLRGLKVSGRNAN